MRAPRTRPAVHFALLVGLCVSCSPSDEKSSSPPIAVESARPGSHNRLNQPKPPQPPHPGDPLDAPIDRAWPEDHDWAGAEDTYGRFVEAFGRAVAAGRCPSFDECIALHDGNPLPLPLESHLALHTDCADLPYLLRAYVAFRLGLPFTFVSRIDGQGASDDRFLNDVRPAAFLGVKSFASARALFESLPGVVHSGMLRTAPAVEESDFYPVKVGPESVVPGAVFYDPGGHVLVVVSVDAGGTVSFVDGHPDGTLTFTRLPAAAVPGPRALGGGFKRFRPPRLAGGRIVATANGHLADFDDHEQWDQNAWRAHGHRVSYAAWVRSRLGHPNVRPDPLADFNHLEEELCRDLTDRAFSVARAAEAGLPAKPHPDALPDNIYGGPGEWESYSTPGKDARLRAGFRALRELARGAGRLRRKMKVTWLAAAASPGCQIHYANGDGNPIPLALDDVLDRLFTLSFDPYDCPERRWGAPARSVEARSCRSDPVKDRFYRNEQRLRNRLERGFGEPTPLSAGPPNPPDVDPRPLLGIPRTARIIRQKGSTR